MQNANSDKPELSYSELYKAAMAQVGQRKGLIVSRSIKISWPFAVWIGLGGLLTTNNGNSGPLGNGLVFGIFMIWFVFAVFYYLVLHNIFELEQVIWIDSFYSGQNLAPADSWKKAKSLFFPEIFIKIRILLRYWLPSLILWLIWMIVSLIYVAHHFSSWVIIPLLILDVVLLILLHLYFATYKFRYLWFVFYDLSKQGHVKIKDVYHNLGLINRQHRSETFKKAFVSNFSIGLGEAAANSVNGFIFHNGLWGHSRAAGAISGAISTETGEIISESGSYAKVVMNFLIYRFALDQLQKSETPEYSNT